MRKEVLVVNNVVKTISLPTNVEDAPSVSLHLLAKNADSVVGRLLDNVGPFVEQIRVILNDTTDASEKIVRGRMARWPTSRLDVQLVTHETHPQFYFVDVAGAYEAGHPLAGESFEGPFTGDPLLCDWAAVRNLGWESGCAWRLFLDADDLVDDPQSLPGVVSVLSSMRADWAASRYVFGMGTGGANSVAFRERLAENVPYIKWSGKTHEVLAGGLRMVLLDDRLRVTDLKDNWGRGVRVPGRCFKVLYRDARLADWDVPPRHLAYLVQESPQMMPVEWVSGALLGRYLEASKCAEERAWVLSMVGELWEAREDYGRAVDYYERATGAYPSAKDAFRACRARFLQRRWRECVDAYELGLSFLSESQVLDAGPVYADSSKLLVAQALVELGESSRAREMVDEAAAKFPCSSAVVALRERIHGTS